MPPPPDPTYRRWLHLYALAMVVLTFSLIAVGGTVTSRAAGLAVPDWPGTFGHNMFTAPPELWWYQSDTFWEHFHRLMGSLVGMWAIGLAAWLAVTQRHRRWLVAAGVGLLGLIIVQGVMGGLRVTEVSTTLAIVHGVTGQIILGLTVLVAAATSRVWVSRFQSPGSRQPIPAASPVASEAKGGTDPARAPRGLRYLALVLILLLVGQLMLGALIRHTGATLAIPDFPTSYGQLLPPLDQPQLDRAIEAHPLARRPFTVNDVALHFSHRIGAGVVLVAAVWLVVWLNVGAGVRPETRWPARWLMALLGVQVALGASVVWSGGYPEVATAHQATGAALLAVATWLAIRVHLLDYAGADHEPQHRQAGREHAAPAAHQKEQPA